MASYDPAPQPGDYATPTSSAMLQALLATNPLLAQYAPQLGLTSQSILGSYAPLGEDVGSTGATNYLQDALDLTLDPAMAAFAGPGAYNYAAFDPVRSTETVATPNRSALQVYASGSGVVESLLAGMILNGASGSTAYAELARRVREAQALSDDKRTAIQQQLIDAVSVPQTDNVTGQPIGDGSGTAQLEFWRDWAVQREADLASDPQAGTVGATYADDGTMISSGGEQMWVTDDNGNQQLVMVTESPSESAQWYTDRGLSLPTETYSAPRLLGDEWQALASDYGGDQALLADQYRQSQAAQRAMEAFHQMIPAEAMDQYQAQQDAANQFVSSPPPATTTINVGGLFDMTVPGMGAGPQNVDALGGGGGGRSRGGGQIGNAVTGNPMQSVMSQMVAQMMSQEAPPDGTPPGTTVPPQQVPTTTVPPQQVPTTTVPTTTVPATTVAPMPAATTTTTTVPTSPSQSEQAYVGQGGFSLDDFVSRIAQFLSNPQAQQATDPSQVTVNAEPPLPAAAPAPVADINAQAQAQIAPPPTGTTLPPGVATPQPATSAPQQGPTSTPQPAFNTADLNFLVNGGGNAGSNAPGGNAGQSVGSGGQPDTGDLPWWLAAEQLGGQPGGQPDTGDLPWWQAAEQLGGQPGGQPDTGDLPWWQAAQQLGGQPGGQPDTGDLPWWLAAEQLGGQPGGGSTPRPAFNTADLNFLVGNPQNWQAVSDSTGGGGGGGSSGSWSDDDGDGDGGGGSGGGGFVADLTTALQSFFSKARQGDSEPDDGSSTALSLLNMPIIGGQLRRQGRRVDRNAERQRHEYKRQNVRSFQEGADLYGADYGRAAAVAYLMNQAGIRPIDRELAARQAAVSATGVTR